MANKIIPPARPRLKAGRKPGPPSLVRPLRLLLTAWQDRDALARRERITKRAAIELALREAVARRGIASKQIAEPGAEAES